MVTIINVFGNQIFNYKYKKNMVEQATPKEEMRVLISVTTIYFYLKIII